MSWFAPGELFNPVTAPPTEALTGWEIAAGPFGLLFFLPFVPLLRRLARRNRWAALWSLPVAWLFLTLGPLGTPVFLACVALGAAWIVWLGQLRDRQRLSPRGMIALTWVGLHLLVLYIWWVPNSAWFGWQPLRVPILHNVGFAYFLLRFIAWGHARAQQPGEPVRWRETTAWLLYPPCMRLGPVMTRAEFLRRFDAWDPRQRVPWRAVLQRLGLFFLGGFLLAVTLHNTPRVPPDGPDFFTAPQLYTTAQLVALLYLIPIQIYLLLWTYNELAAALALWIGIPVDNNFNWLPLATSVRDFWRRWHITVGAWLRDNIYIPLGGNRGIVWLNYLAVFAYVGVWHGPSWSFLAWGLAQAAALVLQRRWDQLRDHVPWLARLSGPVWTGICWLATMHFAVVTIVVFTDFQYLGSRFFAELLQRL